MSIPPLTSEERAELAAMDPLGDAMLRNALRVMDTVVGKPALNAETLLSDKPATNLTRSHEAIGTLNGAASPTTADLAPLMRDLATHYAGGPDGPIREPGDDVPSASDIYTDEELCEQLDKHRSRAAKLGLYDIAADLNIANDRLTEQAEQLVTARDTVQMLLDKLSFLGYGNCPRDERCLMNHDHAGSCVTNHSELARIRREADAAESVDE
jgi:hypothetical protein